MGGCPASAENPSNTRAMSTERLPATTAGNPVSSAGQAAASRLQRRRLIDQHDRDVVAHRVADAARVTHERRLSRSIFQVALAPGAHEDCEELLRERHRDPPCGTRYPKRRRACELLRQ